MSYVDGFVVPVPKKNLKAYLAIAKKAGQGLEGPRRDRILRMPSPTT